MTLQSKRLWGFILVIAIGLFPAAGVLAATLQDSPAGQSKQIFLPVVANGSAANSAPLRVANHIIVKYSGDVHGQAIDEAFATYGATLVKAIPQIGAQVMELPADKVDAAIAGLSQQPGIAYVEPDYVARRHVHAQRSVLCFLSIWPPDHPSATSVGYHHGKCKCNSSRDRLGR